MFFLRTNTKEMMRVSRIFGVVVVAAHVWWLWGFWTKLECVSFWEKYLLHYGSFEAFGIEGMWGVKLIALTDPTLNLCPISKRNHVEVVDLVFMGILLLGMNCHFHETTCWLLERKLRWEIDPLRSIESKE
jgi:hypothetical protein